MQLKPLHIIPLVFSVASFILVMLVFFAGRQDGFLEEYDLIRLDLSNIGDNLFQNMQDLIAGTNEPKAKDKDDDDDEKDKGKRGLGKFVGDAVGGAVGNVVEDNLGSARGKIAEELGDAIDDLKQKILEKLDLSDWYSLHLQSFCKGSFKNGTGSELVVEECTTMEPRRDIELPMDDNELWPKALTRRLNSFKVAIDAIYIFYVMAIVTQGILLGTGVYAAFLAGSEHGARARAWNVILSGLALVWMLVASAAATASSRVVAEAITDIGDSVGVVATAGAGFVSLTWAAFGVSGCVFVYWIILFMRARKMSRSGFKGDM